MPDFEIYCMKPDDPQNARSAKEDVENNRENSNHQNSIPANVSKHQHDANIHQAGLGRDRMMNAEDSEELNDYDQDDLKNEGLNASNDQ